ncbi:MAG: hypothetical protein Athens071426_93 [Parcubacteria group bacterium Athens0714_26]|nr:MAG: hypothetical protein Athens101426_329 [Parcubacteria group bacterium Athens1014_26]TSD03699.1 MAG: hypothetical protein Athens071426_93 [Parcubacteria group bacterium Athens0714_26]
MININNTDNLKNDFVSTAQAAEILGVSRVTVFKKIKDGKIPAQKVGRNYIIQRKYLVKSPNNLISPEDKKIIEKTVKRVIDEYGVALKKLGDA